MGRKRPRVEHRTLTPQQTREIEQGGVVIAPGIWIDRRQGLHFNIPEILAHLGLPETPEDCALATQVITDLLARTAPGTRIVHTDEGTDG